MMNVLKSILFLISLLIIPLVIIPIYADDSGITASTNKNSYQPGDKVIISGSVGQIVNGNPVAIIVRSPMGNVYDVGQVNLLNNLFVHDFVLNDNSVGGTYTINIKYNTSSDQLHFVLDSGALSIIPVFDSEIKIRTNGTNLIKYSNVVVSSANNTIQISMDTSQVPGISVNQEYQIPKTIIDAPGGNILVKIDGAQILCAQSETDTMRILDCTIPANSKEIELVGTMVIPEFGPLTGLAISISVITAVVLSRASKIHL
ncbi:MAG TPA: hypothetical protein VJ571_03100 [Candidatus Nitrosotalea sp.]|nr:hypothetical protein [Candidatus Nitrosotalea sp.]